MQLAESLESRCLLAVTPILINGTELLVQLEAGDNVVIQSDPAGKLEVLSSGLVVNGNPDILTADITSIMVMGGDGSNLIDLTGVTTADFDVALTITVNGGDGGDTILGSEFADSLVGGNGADSITGALADDTLEGSNGNDTLSGGVGDDSILGGDGADSINGDVGNDTVIAGNGADNVSGGDGTDSLNGSDGTDTLNGDAGDDTLSGDNGTDSLLGGADNDSILGGTGNDTASGGDGLDTLNGGADNDSLNGDDGTDSLDGGDGNDTLLGGAGNDTINGGTGNDSVRGLDGDDSILGGSGNDTLFGDDNAAIAIGTGNDTVLGNAGNDTLNGGGGADSLDGQAGNDLVQSGDIDSVTLVIITISNAANVIEGSIGQVTNAVFTVSLNRASSQTITVQYTTADGSATQPSDYTLTTNTLQFAPNTTTATIQVPVIGDGTDESDENFFVRLANATNSVIGDTEGEAFIVDDDGWIPLGPASSANGQIENVVPNNEVNGAIHAVLPHPTDPNIVFVGGVNGGVWRTNNAQAGSPNWIPLTDFQAALSIAALSFDATNTNTIVAGIGRHSSFGFDGGDLPGLLRSDDLGNTWRLITNPLLQGKNGSSVAVRGNTMLFGADFNFGTGVGLFRSTDGGVTWNTVSGTNGLAAGGVADIVGDPTNPNRFYATVLGQGLFRSDDQGATWINVSANDTSTNGLNARMANAANNNAEMAVSNNGRIFVGVMLNGQLSYFGFSSDQGASWTAMDLPQTQESNGDIEGLQPRVKPGGQGMIHFSIAADPTNPNLIYVGGDRQDTPFPNFLGAVAFSGRLFRGDTTVTPTGAVPSPQWAHITHSNSIAAIPNGGTASGSSPHADSRDMAFDAAGNLIEVDDGGAYRRTSPRTNTGDWFSINGDIQVTEQHDFAYDPVADIAMSGNQDTGTTEQISSGSRQWNSVSQADGGDVSIDTLGVPGQSIRYSSFQNLGAFRGRIVDASNVVQSTFFPALTVAGGGAALQVRFVTPTMTNQVAGNRLLIGGSNSLYESTNRGTAITEVGAGIVTNNGNTLIYGGIQNGVPNPEFILTAEGNQLFRRVAAGNTFTTLAFPGNFIVALAADPRNVSNVYAADAANAVWRSTDAGTTWVNITGNLVDPDLRAVEFLVGQSGQSDSIAAGGRLGLYRMLLTSVGTWAELGASSLPNTPISEMDYSPANDTLYLGTMGRGAWAFPNVSFGEQIGSPVPGAGGGVTITPVGDTLIGGDGNDTLIGADGNDFLNGMAGNDSLFGGLGTDSMLGGAGADSLDGSGGDDTVDGQGGNDLVKGGDGSDTYVWNGTGDGVDTLSSLSGYDRVRVQGSAVANNFVVSQNNGQLRITDGVAVLNVSPVIQVVDILAGGGDDTITIGTLDRVRTATLLTVNGGDGNDTINSNGASIGLMRVSLIGGLGDDSLTGSAGIDSLDGGDGDDALDGQGGNDLIFAGLGDDTILGGAGNDRIFAGDGSDNIDAGAGDDAVIGDVGADTINGGDGNDTLDGGDGTDTIDGGSGNDSILGGNEADVLNGNTGNDTVRGGGSDDKITGENGNDKLYGDDGNDSILGHDGEDTINGGDGDDTLDGMAGNDLIGGGNGDDLMNGAAGNDVLTGGDGNDTMAGGAGNDVLLGDEGDDSLNGQGSFDTINPGEGSDTVFDPINEINTTFTLSAALLAALA